jgi:hypothetical protein
MPRRSRRYPAMTGMHQLWRDGKLAVVRGVGYPNPIPNPNHSHFSRFVSMDIWQTASPTDPGTSGWLGRWFDVQPGGDELRMLRAVSLGVTVVTAARGPETEEETAGSSLPIGRSRRRSGRCSRRGAGVRRNVEEGGGAKLGRAASARVSVGTSASVSVGASASTSAGVRVAVAVWLLRAKGAGCWGSSWTLLPPASNRMFPRRFMRLTSVDSTLTRPRRERKAPCSGWWVPRSRGSSNECRRPIVRGTSC